MLNSKIKDAFDDNIYFQKMLKVFTLEQVGDLYYHHIVPKCFFKKEKLECDNSENNLIALSYKNHLLVHLYGYLCAKDIIKEEMLNAIQLMLNTSNRFNEQDAILEAEKEIALLNVPNERRTFFLNKAKKKYGNNFGYSKVNYINADTKVLIHCNICNNDFWQLPYNHLRYGCPCCSGKLVSFETFLKKANSIHNNKYIYDRSTFVNMSQKMKIICPLHGEFWQRPTFHINRKEGCPKCRYITSSEKNKKDTSYFIGRAKFLYGNKFDYSKVKYENYNTKVILICNTCGKEFERTPNHFFGGRLCPYCKRSKK